MESLKFSAVHVHYDRHMKGGGHPYEYGFAKKASTLRDMNMQQSHPPATQTPKNTQVSPQSYAQSAQ
jgi:hypothetical protein